MRTLGSVAALCSLVALAGCDNPGRPAIQSSAQPSATAAAAPLKEGDAAPDVDLPLQNGKTVKLSTFRGKPVALYFYPKDETAGCTVEAQGFRDGFADLQAAGVTVIGVSTQDAVSHQAFIDKEKLPFDLAVDAGGAIAKAFQVPVNNGYAARQTFLIGADGKLKKIWRQVTPAGHAAEILAAAKS